MQFEQKNDISRSRWSARTGRLIDVVCLLALIAVVVTVIYGFALRAIWAHGYYIAVAVAMIGAIAMMIGLAQQVIAARDAATWHDMAVWQLRAAHGKTQGGSISETLEGTPPLGMESADYYAQLIRAFLESVQHDDGRQSVK